MQRISLSRIRQLSRLRPTPASPFAPRWVCAACERRGGVSRRLASTSTPTTPADATSQKPYYVTTPIFYVNASPHIGHMYTMVLADVLKRYRVLRGERALLCTGTDEHGTKIQRAAAQNDMEPKQLCDANSAVFADLARASQVDNDFFVRTTDEDHKDAVCYFWDTLVRRGYIYEDKHAGWYCVSDETFYPESLIEKRMDPVTGKVFLASKESGAAVEWVEEKTYQFRMTALRDRLLDFFKENPDWVVPLSRMREVEDWVRNNLEDLSVSRPASRLRWGIPVPDDPSQTIYVWLDALVNYITKAGYPGWAPGRESEGGWPADVHVVGKDIVRFHCIYWPALLMAADLPLPRKVLTHGHWTLGNRKMSKSVGNVVNPFLAMDRFGVDAVRYFLMSPANISDDADYGNELVVDKYKKQLQSGLGNLLGRVTRSKCWNVSETVARACAHPAVYQLPSQHQVLTALPVTVEKHFEQPEPERALREIMSIVVQTNKFITDMAPWELVKHPDDVDKQKQMTATIFYCAEALRISGILLQPFMPTKAAELLDILGVHETRRTWAYTNVGADSEYGAPFRHPGGGAFEGLFPPLPVAS
ncbi:hypothetical protein RB594_009024 [Gaeumannomyces avenae]